MKQFLDTYALVEILNGNPAYRGELDGAGTSLFHLFELHVQLSRLRDANTADTVFGDLRPLAAEVEDADVLAASRFKRAHPKKRLSYADALGYAMAKQRGIPFVTGDIAFRAMDGVRFIAGRSRG
jgi:predicted nucleic acid-binding protein